MVLWWDVCKRRSECVRFKSSKRGAVSSKSNFGCTHPLEDGKNFTYIFGANYINVCTIVFWTLKILHTIIEGSGALLYVKALFMNT
jgi:hypothetical protein